MSYPLVRIVAAPDPAAEVLFDFNSDDSGGASRRVASDGWSIGTPLLEGDVDAVDPLYGPRELSFTDRVEGTKAQALAVQSAMARQLLRGPAWLYFKLAPSTEPVWFRTLRAERYELSFEHVYDDENRQDLWEVGVTLPAEPFAYGERVSLDPVTVSNDPARGTNRCHLVLPQILGDAPTPLRVEVSPTGRGTGYGYRWLLASHSGSDLLSPFVWNIGTGDVWTPDADTSAPITDAAYSDGEYRNVPFANPAMISRFGGVPPTLPTPGRHKVLLRAARSDTSSTFAVRFYQVPIGPFGGAIEGPIAVLDRPTSAAVGYATWLDLGDFTFPPGHAAPIEFPIDASTYPRVGVMASRLSGAGALHLDALLLLPLDTPGSTWESRTMLAGLDLPAADDVAGRDVFDGDIEGYWKVTAAGAVTKAVSPSVVGQFPRAVPGAENVLAVMPQVNAPGATGEAGGDSIATDTEVTVSYHPRWVWIGDR